MNVACAVQALNILYLDELVDWKMSQNFKKVNRKDYGAGLIGLHLVYLPSYMNVRVLPYNLKVKATKHIYNLIEKYDSKEFNYDPYGKQRWLGLVKYMKDEDWSGKLPALIEYLAITDSTRKTDFSKVFPELNVMANSIQSHQE